MRADYLLWLLDHHDGHDPLEVLLRRPPWHADALCAEPDHAGLGWVPATWSRPPPDLEAMRQVCARCLVTRECLRGALAEHDTHAVRAGTTPSERRELARGTEAA